VADVGLYDCRAHHVSYDIVADMGLLHVSHDMEAGGCVTCRAHHVSCVQLFLTSSPVFIIKTVPTTSSWSHRTQCHSLPRRSIWSQPTYR